ncbi:hypothetical protein TNIN_412981 [Trichonephila inaurata madagascariensis]|uniref:Uncharacterized protein n=1 Tax=Trichonephila inaurata madagascariensis TaxID=2747483 RepID=A0A8X6WVC2_9ARAC|nr:hypothetical protein TNIN_412981 [Trichonephila inaurata madagascariensis]
MSDTESENESMKSYKSNSTKSYKSRSSLSSKSSSSTPGLPISDCERRRKAIKKIDSYDHGILTQQKMIEYHFNYGNKKDILEAEAFMKLTDEKEKLISELRNFPPCLDTDCPEHTLLKTNVIGPELTNPKTKKQSQKSKGRFGWLCFS